MNTPTCKSCEVLARHGKTALLHTCGLTKTTLSKCCRADTWKDTAGHLCIKCGEPCTTVPEREEKFCTGCTVRGKRACDPECDCECHVNPPSEKQEAEGLDIETLTEKIISSFHGNFTYDKDEVLALLFQTRKEAFEEGQKKWAYQTGFLTDPKKIEETRKEATEQERKRIREVVEKLPTGWYDAGEGVEEEYSAATYRNHVLSALTEPK